MNSDEKRKLETNLMVLGLKRLDDPELIPQMAAIIKDHDFYLGMLNECDKEKRREMYDALKPYLKFKPYPLDTYLNRIKEHAAAVESRNEPIQIGAKAYQEVKIDDATGCVLTMTCSKCRKFKTYYEETPVAAVSKARKDGWVRDLILQREICPKCPAVREPREVGRT